MKKFTNKTTIFLGVLVLLSVSLAFVWPLKKVDAYLYLIYDGTRAGEKSQVLGVAHSLKEILPSKVIQKEFDLKDQATFVVDIEKNLPENSPTKGIVIAAEVGGIDVLCHMKAQKNIVVAHLSHQYTKDHADLKDVADIVALPRYVVTNEISKIIEGSRAVLIQTPGVSHDLSTKIIREAYRSNKDRVPLAPTYIGIILGGDAETPDKKVRYYTREEAVQAALYVASLVREKKAHLLILNGPRTGKHDQNTGRVIESSHRDGSLDAITKVFKDTLLKQGLTEAKDFTVFDFQFGKPSAYPVVLGALRKSKSPIYVAGESTSMVSETADCLPRGLVTAYTNNAMNETHRKHCASENEAGRIDILENHGGKWHLLEARTVRDSKTSRPASQIIAESIKKRFEEKMSL